MKSDDYHKGLTQGNVVRCSAHRYAQVSMTICYERGLSAKALGLYAKMQSLADDFHFTLEGFAKLFRDGKDGVRSGLQELERLGYLVRAQRRATGGRYNDDTVWVTLDEPGMAEGLRTWLEEHHYEVLTPPVKREDATRPNVDYWDLERRLAAVEAAYDAAREEHYREYDHAYRKEVEARIAASLKAAGEQGFPQSRNARSEPMSENPTTVATWGDAAPLESDVENLGGKPTPEPWDDAEEWHIPWSEPMSENPTTVVTCENGDFEGRLPRSEPMLEKPTSENPTQSSKSSCIVSPTPPNSTQPETSSTYQVYSPQAPAGAAADVVDALESLAAIPADAETRLRCESAAQALLDAGRDAVALSVECTADIMADPKTDPYGWLMAEAEKCGWKGGGASLPAEGTDRAALGAARESEVR